MARRRGDLRNDHVVDLRAARLDVFGFNAGASQQFSDLFRIFGRSTNSRSQLMENLISSQCHVEW
jgi:hypothetical protein